jgi:hypothetical protein
LTRFCTVNNIRPLYRHPFGLVEALNEGEARMARSGRR